MRRNGKKGRRNASDRKDWNFYERRKNRSIEDRLRNMHGWPNGGGRVPETERENDLEMYRERHVTQIEMHLHPKMDAPHVTKMQTGKTRQTKNALDMIKKICFFQVLV